MTHREYYKCRVQTKAGKISAIYGEAPAGEISTEAQKIAAARGLGEVTIKTIMTFGSFEAWAQDSNQERNPERFKGGRINTPAAKRAFNSSYGMFGSC